MADVEKLLQSLSFLQWLKSGQVAGEFIAVEDVPHCCLKTRKLSSELQATVGCLCKGQQFLAEKIIERALDAELLLDPAGRPALLYPDLFEPDAGDYIAWVIRRQTNSGNREDRSIRCISLDAYEETSGGPPVNAPA